MVCGTVARGVAEPYITPLPSAAPGPLVPQFAPALAPIRSEHCANETEADLNELFARLLESTLRPALRDIDTLAMPQLGSNEQFELAANRSGLGIYRRSDDEAMRLLYRAWMGQNPRRGLHMLRLYLRLLFPGGWTCDQLWHPEDKPYPTALNKTGGPGHFLTSRVEVTIKAEDMDETDVLRILPALLSVTPARIVLDINIETNAKLAPLRIAAAAAAYGVSIFSARATTSQGAEASLSSGVVAMAASLGFVVLQGNAVARPVDQ